MNQFNQKAHHDLLAEWRNVGHHKGKPFFSDGIIVPDEWHKRSLKIMFLNKEAHDSNAADSEGLDLVEMIREKWDGHPEGPTMTNCAYWAYALLVAWKNQDCQLPDWRNIPGVGDRQLAEAFCSVAVVNIKKSNGRTRSSDADLRDYANKDGRLIRRQVDLINPDVLVAGRTLDLVQDQWPKLTELGEHVYHDGQRVIVDYWHPSNRAVDEMKYFALAHLLQKSGALKWLKQRKSI